MVNFMLTKNEPKVGLVLTGGGAKGAYHIGAVKALAELNIPIHGVSGASIGALNGAIVSTSESMHSAHETLNRLWTCLVNDSVISVSNKVPIYCTAMAGMGAAFGAIPALGLVTTSVVQVADWFGVNIGTEDFQILDDSPLVKLLEENTSPDAFKAGLPFYVSVYESSGAIKDISNVIKASFRLGNTHDSEFLRIQSLSDHEMQRTLMASAALPLLFKAQTLKGKRYTDGGQGDWYGVGGNTPVKPLVDAGFDTIIVIHLCDGSPWDRTAYPNTNIIEVRPRDSIAQGGTVSDLLGFDHHRLKTWSQQGYEDTKHCLERVTNSIKRLNLLSESQETLEQSLNSHSDLDKNLEQAMARLTQHQDLKI
jgi:NTE family protein